MIVVDGDIVVALFVLGVCVVIGVVSYSCYCSYVVEVIVIRVCVVALPSDLFRESESWCVVFVIVMLVLCVCTFGIVFVLIVLRVCVLV